MSERIVSQPLKAPSTDRAPSTERRAGAGLLQRKCACGGSSGLTGECAECGKKRLTLQRYSTRKDGPDLAPPVVHEALRSPGQPLDQATRDFMKARFGHDFSRVRIHSDARADESARAVNAQAYTVGANVVFAAGKYQPATSQGRQLLAHELTHVVQQQRMPLAGGDISIEPSHSASDAEADRIADAVVGADHEPPHPPAIGIVGRGLQRKGLSFGGFFANLFQFWDYSEETLQKYLKVLDDTRDIEDDDDSDDKARQVVRDWKSGASKFNLTPSRKALLIREMLSGRVLGSDQEGILVLLNSANSAELSHFFGPGGVRHQKLLAEFGVRKKDLLEFYRSRYDIADEKEIAKNPEPLQQPKEKPRGRELTFNEALAEGAQVLHKAGFGKVCGIGIGPDEGDGYDAREWKEIGKEKLVATSEPWLAFQHLVKNLGKDVPSATGGKTKWSFDCDGFTVTNMVYADWRMLTREEFNKTHRPLELGMDSRVKNRWEITGPTMTKPGEKPFTEEPPVFTGGGVSEAGEQKFLNKPMKKLLEEAPIGSKVTWTNIDALKKCEKSNWDAKGTLGFCNWAHENTLKVGLDKYSAHDLGVVSESEIKDGMAKAVFKNKPVPKGYIEKNIFVASIRHPKQQKAETI